MKYMKKEKYPEGHFVGQWMAIGIAIFVGFGIPLSILTENFGIMGIWPAVGLSLGLAIGSSVEEKYKKEGKIRPLTKEEKKTKSRSVIVGLLTLLVLVIIGFVIFIVRM